MREERARSLRDRPRGIASPRRAVRTAPRFSAGSANPKSPEQAWSGSCIDLPVALSRIVDARTLPGWRAEEQQFAQVVHHPLGSGVVAMSEEAQIHIRH